MTLMGKNFLLTNEWSKKLFFNYAKDMPIVDFHCHLSPKEIYENKNYQNITRIWLNDGTYGDHYKWRLMRTNGIPERLITGDADDYDKFIAWADTIEHAVGNPVYEWTHLELRRFFGIDEPLTTENAPEVWKKANKLLQTNDFKPRNLIKLSNVKVVCTTDDPADDLYYHKLLKKDEYENGFRVLPAMRPDNLIYIEKPEYGNYLKKLSKVSNTKITSFKDIITAMDKRFSYFNEMGSRLSDHSLSTFHFIEASDKEINKIVEKGINNEQLTSKEHNQYLTMLVESLMKLNKKYNWTMQFHNNVLRSINHPMFDRIGADTGFDAMGTQPDMASEMQKLFTKMKDENSLPKIILYSLNPNDWLQLVTMMQCFQEGGKQRMQLGAAWWFNDTAEGMTQQLRTYAQQSLLPNFVGMLTDSRSFLSYPRHEYFRRVLCNFLGQLVEEGRAPENEKYLGKIVQNISYYNARDYFGFFDGENIEKLFAKHSNRFQFR